MCKLDFSFSDWYQVAIKGRRGFYGVAANICSPLTLCIEKTFKLACLPSSSRPSRIIECSSHYLLALQEVGIFIEFQAAIGHFFKTYGNVTIPIFLLRTSSPFINTVSDIQYHKRPCDCPFDFENWFFERILFQRLFKRNFQVILKVREHDFLFVFQCQLWTKFRILFIEQNGRQKWWS